MQHANDGSTFYVLITKIMDRYYDSAVFFASCKC